MATRPRSSARRSELVDSGEELGGNEGRNPRVEVNPIALADQFAGHAPLELSGGTDPGIEVVDVVAELVGLAGDERVVRINALGVTLGQRVAKGVLLWVEARGRRGLWLQRW